jgi:hypothetical protein
MTETVPVYLGRFRLGESVEIVVQCDTVDGRPSDPDDVPIATVYDSENDVPVTSSKLSSIAGSAYPGLFKCSFLLDSEFSVGRYTVYERHRVGSSVFGSAYVFDLVAGGDVAGDVISLAHYTRPESTFVVAQVSAGRIIMGRNPKVET